MILRTSAVAAVLAAAARPSPSLAFQTQRFQPLRTFHHPRRAPIAAPRMSTIPDDEDDENVLFGPFKTQKGFLGKIKSYSLPPAPEDLIALGGDVVALFVYSYLDHTVNEIYSDTAAKVDNVADLVALPDPTTLEGTAASLPVWFDPADLPTYGHNWLAVNSVEVPYAPAIAHSGLAFVAIATSWIVCGYFSGAFLNSNTLECDPTRAMMVTLRTWMGTCFIMVLLALGSDALWGELDTINALSAPARGGLTKADADFIFDSLTVLAFWRFMFNWLLGYRK